MTASRLTTTLRTGAGVIGITALQSVVIALTFIVLANRLGPAAYGIIAFAMAAGSFAPIVAGLGGEFVLVMHGSRDPAAAPELLGNALLARLVLSVVALLATHVVGVLINFSDIATLDIVAAGLLIAAIADPLLVAYFRVERRLLQYYAISFTGRTALLIFVVLALKGPADVRLAAGGYLGSQLLVTLTSLAVILRRAKPRVSFGRAMAHRRDSALFTVSQLVDVAVTRMDVIILYAVTTLAAVGVYNAGYRIASVLLTLPAAVQSVILPDFHQAAADGSQRLRRVFEATLASLTELAVLACGVFVVAHSHVADVLLGDEYIGAGPVIALIAVALGVTYVGYAYAMLAEAQRRIGQRLVVRIAAAAVGFVATAYLASRWGATGAAAGTLIGSLAFVSLLAIVTTRGLQDGVIFPFAAVGLGATATTITLLVQPLLPHGWPGLLLVILIFIASLAIPAAVLLSLHLVELRSVTYVRQLWQETPFRELAGRPK